MYTITISKELKEVCPVFTEAAVYAEVKSTSYCEGLWEEIQSFTEKLTATAQLEDIKKQPVIAATRRAYKRCGRNPGRCRLSTKALRCRLMRGIALYQVDTLVDLVNLVSFRTGHSVGGFDADKIAGINLKPGIGRKEEPFEGTDRGVLNMEGLPVYRDAVEEIGALTSDNERTKMDLEATRILTIINGYNRKEGLQETAGVMQTSLRRYARSDGGAITYFE